MGMKNMNIGVVVEAKQEYTRQMIIILQPLMYEAFITLYTNALEEAESELDVMNLFKTELGEVENWNSVIINKETTRIINECPYFNDLLTAIVLSNVKILTSIRLQNKKQNVQVTVPTNETFVLQLYTLTSKKLINNIQLFDASRYNDDISNNLNEIYDIIDICVQNAIRVILPVNEILKSTLNKEGENDSSDEESGEEMDVPSPPDGIDEVAFDDDQGDQEDQEDPEDQEDQKRTIATSGVMNEPETSMMDNLMQKPTIDQMIPPPTVPLTTSSEAPVLVQGQPTVVSSVAPVAQMQPNVSVPVQVSVSKPPARSFFDDVED